MLVLIDYENIRYTPKHAFGTDKVDFSPLLFSELIVARRRMPSFLLRTHVYRGIPDPNFDGERSSQDMSRINKWTADHRVVAITRPLQYVWRNGARTRFEKGIDVSLAIDLIRHAHSDVDADVVVASRVGATETLEFKQAVVSLPVA